MKDALRTRHPATYLNGSKPTGLWTCIEEWRNIDLLAVCAWASCRPYPRYARVGYEVKVSRSDYKRELAAPGKRRQGVSFCHEFYFAVPLGLLKPDEIAWVAPWGFEDAGPPFERLRCPGIYGAFCNAGALVGFGTVDRHRRYASGRADYSRTYYPRCPLCDGAGWVAESPAVRADAPRLWVPADVGLVVVTSDGKTHVAKKAPRRQPAMTTAGYEADRIGDGELADLFRWISTRPDPRHAVLRQEAGPGASCAPLAASDASSHHGQGRDAHAA